MLVRVRYQVDCLEDGTSVMHGSFIQRLSKDAAFISQELGFPKPGKWKKGLHAYHLWVGNSDTEYTGTFVVS